MIPEFDPGSGNLPAGVHQASWNEFQARFGFNEHRRKLLAGLRDGLELLSACRCERVFVDGSFVTTKEVPGDFDACWSVIGIDEDLLDPIFLDFANSRANQKARFSGEFFPAEFPAHPSGIRYLEFFQRDRNGTPKGIVMLATGELT